MLIVKRIYFILLVSEQVNAVVFIIISNDPYAKLCVPDVLKNLNIKVFNLMSRTNETRHIEWHETCKCKCRIDKSACNKKQRWNEDKCRCECKELVDKGACDIIIVSANVINLVILVSILIMKTVNVGKIS